MQVSNRWRFGFLMLTAGLLGTPAMAQLVTPPTSAPAASDPFKIPERPPEPPKVDMAPGKGGEMPPPPPPTKIEEKLPDLPYKSLVEMDANGKLKLLTKPVDIAALEVNPTITDEATKKKIAEYLAERRARFEHILTENVDLAEKLFGGALDTLDLTDRNQIGEFNSMIKPLTQPAAPSNVGLELTKRGLITDVQKRFNDKIKKEYEDARTKAFREAQPPAANKGDGARSLISSMMKRLVEEQELIFNDMLVEAGKSLDKTLPQVGLDTQGIAKAKDALKAMSASDADQVKGMKDVLQGLSVDQKKALLRKTVELRGK